MPSVGGVSSVSKAAAAPGARAGVSVGGLSGLGGAVRSGGISRSDQSVSAAGRPSSGVSASTGTRASVGVSRGDQSVSAAGRPTSGRTASTARPVSGLGSIGSKGLLVGQDPYAAARRGLVQNQQNFQRDVFNSMGDINSNLQPGFSNRLFNAVVAARNLGLRQDNLLNEGTRSNQVQQGYYNAYKAGKGGIAAPPGASNHQYGLAVDMNEGPIREYIRDNASILGLGVRPKGKDKPHVEMGDYGGKLGIYGKTSSPKRTVADDIRRGSLRMPDGSRVTNIGAQVADYDQHPADLNSIRLGGVPSSQVADLNDFAEEARREFPPLPGARPRSPYSATLGKIATPKNPQEVAKAYGDLSRSLLGTEPALTMQDPPLGGYRPTYPAPKDQSRTPAETIVKDQSRLPAVVDTMPARSRIAPSLPAPMSVASLGDPQGIVPGGYDIGDPRSIVPEGYHSPTNIVPRGFGRINMRGKRRNGNERSRLAAAMQGSGTFGTTPPAAVAPIDYDYSRITYA